MIRLLLAALAATALHAPAIAEVAMPPLVLPPAQFDRPYAGRLHVIVRPIEEVRQMCGGPYIYACSSGDAAGRCVIILPSVDGRLVNEAGFHGLHRHEVGHCNGWGANHPGARRG